MTELRVLLALARRPDSIVSQRDIVNEAWATSEAIGGREMVKTTIYRLRRNLANAGVDGLVIDSHRGLGYGLRLEDESR